MIFHTVSRLSRRNFIGSLTRGAAAVAIASTIVGGGLPQAVANAQSADEVSAAANGYYVTTAALNLRSQPSLSSTVVVVMPKGAAVAGVGPEQNGFVKVSYVGNVGWAHGSYLSISNGGSNDTPVYTGIGYTTTSVNMRSGAGLGYSVLRVLDGGTTIELYDSYANNFRLVRYAGQYGWVSIDYIKPGGSSQQPGYKVTTSALNLRSQPSLSASVLKVIPSGAQVAAGDQVSNGFRSVTHAGVTGWAYDAYLK
jgi:uncharacterized protein YraI